MDRSYYRSRRAGAGALSVIGLMGTSALVALTALSGCKTHKSGELDPDDKGRLRKIASNLEDAFASAALPNLTIPAGLADRVARWDDFRSCTVRTYVALKRDADQRAREGHALPSRHASIGDATVEECGVELAIAKKDPSICERLAVDYQGPNGEMPLSAVRCWDTRARVFGEPDECPVVWMPAGVPGRNPECLAMARRDQSVCPFTDSPARCRALITSDSASCGAQDAAPDCALAMIYWAGIIPAGFGAPLVDPAALKGDSALGSTFDLRWEKNERPQIRAQGPRIAGALSWPAGKKTPAWTEPNTPFWGAEVPTEAAQVTWESGSPAVKLAFVPGGASSGVRPLQPPSPTAAATFIAVWSDDPAHLVRCQPGPLTKGEIRFDAGKAEPGAVVSGELKAEHLACSDGSELAARAHFRSVILDVR